MGFCAEQLERLAPLRARMLDHPFLAETRTGKIPRGTFANWMRQDYLFVEAAVPFLGALLPRAPADHQKPHADAIVAIHRELQLFQENARMAGVDLRSTPPSFICHGYVHFLLATAYAASYPEGFTVLYVAEKSYHDSWSRVADGLDPDSPWKSFVDNWAGAPFAGYVAWLEAELDTLAAEAGAAERRRMSELFETTMRYETAFWEMAFTGERWPGIPEDVEAELRERAPEATTVDAGS